MLKWKSKNLFPEAEMDVETKPTGEVRPIRFDEAVSERADCFFCCKKAVRKRWKALILAKKGKKSGYPG